MKKYTGAHLFVAMLIGVLCLAGLPSMAMASASAESYAKDKGGSGTAPTSQTASGTSTSSEESEPNGVREGFLPYSVGAIGLSWSPSRQFYGLIGLEASGLYPFTNRPGFAAALTAYTGLYSNLLAPSIGTTDNPGADGLFVFEWRSGLGLGLGGVFSDASVFQVGAGLTFGENSVTFDGASDSVSSTIFTWEASVNWLSETWGGGVRAGPGVGPTLYFGYNY